MENILFGYKFCLLIIRKPLNNLSYLSRINWINMIFFPFLFDKIFKKLNFSEIKNQLIEMYASRINWICITNRIIKMFIHPTNVLISIIDFII